MSSAALDRLLAVLILIQVASGLLTLRAGIPATAPLVWLHGLPTRRGLDWVKWVAEIEVA